MQAMMPPIILKSRAGSATQPSSSALSRLFCEPLTSRLRSLAFGSSPCRPCPRGRNATCLSFSAAWRSPPFFPPPHRISSSVSEIFSSLPWFPPRSDVTMRDQWRALLFLSGCCACRMSASSAASATGTAWSRTSSAAVDQPHSHPAPFPEQWGSLIFWSRANRNPCSGFTRPAS